MTPLPIDDALPGLVAALGAGQNVVLAAPPGAGKTTRVPLALLGEPWLTGRVLMLEPRRIAARAAAERMAESLGQGAGDTVGYRIRGEARTGPATRIEVVTEGILTRMLQRDPALDGISAVIFDEIHERSIHSDLGLALTLEAQGALRPDLRLVAMSATLDTARLEQLMSARVIESAGRMFPIETRWLDRPWRGPRQRTRFEDAAADLVARAVAASTGDLLVFLPGAGEIARVAARLGTIDADVVPLHGSLPFARQRAALRPDGGRRRVVLATAIAETSITVPGVLVVVDCGLARRAETDPATGLSRLVTVPVSRAEAEQRRGRSGREAPGVCYRMWTKAQEGALPAAATPEILMTDLTSFALELAAWGARPGALAFLDQPPAAAMTEARTLLHALGALDGDGRITAHGRAMAALPAHPRLAHMMLSAGDHRPEAALLAALLSGRDPLAWSGGRPPADLELRIRAVLEPEKTGIVVDRPAVAQIRAEARRLSRGKADCVRAIGSAGGLLAQAWPDRIGLRRPGEAARYLLASGRGAALPPGDPLGASRILVAVDVEDTRPEATIRRGAAIAEATLRALHGGRIVWENTVHWDRRAGQVVALSRERLGQLILAERPWPDAPDEAFGTALIEGIRDLGLERLPWTPRATSLRDRVDWLRAQNGPLAARLPDWSDVGLLATLEDWLLPWISGFRRIEALAALDLAQVLGGVLGHELAQAVDRAAPARFVTPLGRAAAIDYAGEAPSVALRVQEMFGTTRHPVVGEPPVPLVIELLSPAGRPVQTTADLPGFWRTSYADVRKDMRARYPRHPWPDDPAVATPTARAKPRGT